MNDRAEAEFVLGTELLIKVCDSGSLLSRARVTMARECFDVAKAYCDQFKFDDEEMPGGSGFSLASSKTKGKAKMETAYTNYKAGCADQLIGDGPPTCFFCFGSHYSTECAATKLPVYSIAQRKAFYALDSMEYNEAIKPCPFCGEQQRLEALTHNPPAEHLRIIDCIGCGACGPTAASDDEAATLWNRRADAVAGGT